MYENQNYMKRLKKILIIHSSFGLMLQKSFKLTILVMTKTIIYFDFIYFRLEEENHKLLSRLEHTKLEFEQQVMNSAHLYKNTGCMKG